MFHTAPSQCMGTEFFTPALLRQKTLDLNINQVGVTTREQRLFPDITFTCNGAITKWIVGVDTPGDTDSQTQLQIWRRIEQTSTNVYKMINFTTVSDALGEQNGVYNHTLTSPIEFKKGDIFGIYYHRNKKRVVIYNQRNSGPANYRDPAGTLGDPPTYNNLSAVLTDDYDYPLVSVEIGEHYIQLFTIEYNTHKFCTVYYST